MIEVEIENFQSIEKTSVRIEGFTALVGRSNIGKSAIARAIKYALTGALGSDFVRHGPRCERRLRQAKKCKCQTVVRIRTQDVQVVWTKGDEVNEYRVTRDGVEQTYSALDRGEPEFLKPEFQQVQVGDSRDLLQVTEQFDHIFLLNKTGGVVADVLSDVAKLDDINEAIRLVNKDRKDAVSTRNVREKDAGGLRQSVASFSGLDEVLKKTERIEKRYASTDHLRQSAVDIQRFLDALRAMKVSIEGLLAATKPKLPPWDNVSSASERYGVLKRYFDAVSERVPVIKRLSGIDKVALPDVSSAAPTFDRLSKIEEWVSRDSSLQDSISRIQGVSDLQVPDVSKATALHEKLVPLAGWVGRLQALKAAMQKCQGIDRVRDPHEPPSLDQLQDLDRLQSLLARQDRLTQEIVGLEESLRDADEAEQEVVDEFARLGVCPTCTQSIAPDHLHRKAS